MLGTGLFNSDGELWVRRRRILQPVFQGDSLSELDGIIQHYVGQTVERWRHAADRNETVDAGQEMTDLALRIAVKLFFGMEVEGDQAEIAGAIDTLVREYAARFRSPLAALWNMTGFPTPSNRRVQAAQARLNRVVTDITRNLRTNGECLTGYLAGAVDTDTGQPLTSDELRAEVMTLLIAGHETTAMALTWTVYLLSRHPQVQTELRKDVQDGLAGRSPALADLPQLGNVRTVIEEALRLYPPAWAFSRRASTDDIIGGYQIPAGARLMISPFITHRLPEFWTEPEEFRPSRFAPKEAEGRDPYAYIPFGAGPRQCIGRRMALSEATLIVASLAQHFTLTSDDGSPVPPDALVTLRPGRPVLLRPVLGRDQ